MYFKVVILYVAFVLFVHSISPICSYIWTTPGPALPQTRNGAPTGGIWKPGQARSASPLVTYNQNVSALKGRNLVGVISAFQASIAYGPDHQGRRASLRSRLPLAIIFRAVGAASEFW